MRILKIKGKNEQMVMAEIKKEYGDAVIIISKHQEKGEGLFGFLKKSQYVVTIAVEDEEEEATNRAIKDRQSIMQQEHRLKEETYDLLLNLKNQLNNLQKDVDEVKHVTEHTAHSTVTHSQVKQLLQKSNSEEQTLKHMVKCSLEEIGVHEEVANEMMKTIEDDDDIEHLVRKLYDNIALAMGTWQEELLPKVVFFIGSTGVGKTTTIAKLTADYVLNKQKNAVLFTADTYRIAAIEQLKTYADIVGVPIEIIYSEKELVDYMDKWHEAEHIFIDTAGRSHKNIEQIQDMEKLLSLAPEKKVFLTLNMNTAYKDVKNIIDTYKAIVPEFHMIVTKLDETDEIGNLLNIAYYSKVPIVYITHGQNVPQDFSIFDRDSYIKELLGRIKYE